MNFTIEVVKENPKEIQMYHKDCGGNIEVRNTRAMISKTLKTHFYTAIICCKCMKNLYIRKENGLERKINQVLNNSDKKQLIGRLGKRVGNDLQNWKYVEVFVEMKNN